MKFSTIIAIGLVVLVILAGILGPQAFYTLDRTHLGVVTRFGEVKRSVTSEGLHGKVPFIDSVTRFERRLLRVDVPRASMPDRESQFLEIDAYARYRIKDPRQFLENLIDEVTAESRIANIVVAAIREEVGRRTRTEIIGGETQKLEDGTIIVSPLLTEGVPTRQAMMQLVKDISDANVKANQFGIEIVDVRIKRADFPPAAEEAVFGRMRSERKVQADRLRAEGEEQFLTLTADVTRRTTIIAAEAERDANTLRGEGEAEAIGILAEALEKDPEFFAFRRSLEAYTNFLATNTTLVLPASNDLFQYLESPFAAPTPTPTP